MSFTTTSNAEFYGPYTRAIAEKLETDLNRVLGEQRTGHDSDLIATAMPLVPNSPQNVLREYAAQQPEE